jgi:hypothetical protein
LLRRQRLLGCSRLVVALHIFCRPRPESELGFKLGDSLVRFLDVVFELKHAITNMSEQMAKSPYVVLRLDSVRL